MHTIAPTSAAVASRAATSSPASRSARYHNYSIYRHGELLFAYFEYTGDDYDADMAAIAADPETQRWWAVQEPLQAPLDDRAEGEWWSELPEVFHTD